MDFNGNDGFFTKPSSLEGGSWCWTWRHRKWERPSTWSFLDGGWRPGGLDHWRQHRGRWWRCMQHEYIMHCLDGGCMRFFSDSFCRVVNTIIRGLVDDVFEISSHLCKLACGSVARRFCISRRCLKMWHK